MDIGTVTIEHEIDTSKFIDAVFTEDDIGTIIRVHFEAERGLNWLLHNLTDGRSEKVVKSWKFSQKLDLCYLIGMPEKWLSPIKTLNKHRNSFAHGFQSEFTDEQIIELYHQVRRISPKFSTKMQLEVKGKGPLCKKYAECSNKEKYVMLVAFTVGMWAAFLQIKERAETHFENKKNI